MVRYNIAIVFVIEMSIPTKYVFSNKIDRKKYPENLGGRIKPVTI